MQTAEFFLVKVEVDDDSEVHLSHVGLVVFKLIVVELWADAVAECAACMPLFAVHFQILKLRFALAQQFQQVVGTNCLSEGIFTLHILVGHQLVGAVENPSVAEAAHLHFREDGSFRIMILADIQDGKLDLVLIDSVPRWRIPFYLPGLMLSRDLSFKITRHRNVSEIIVEGSQLRVNIDGDIRSMDRAEFRINPGSLMLIR